VASGENLKQVKK